VLADVKEDGIKGVSSEVASAGAEALAVRANVSDESSVLNLKDQTLNRFGRVDILVNNAGIYPHSATLEMAEEEWDRVLDTNLGGNFLCSRAFVPEMRSQKAGRIISIASGIAYRGGKRRLSLRLFHITVHNGKGYPGLSKSETNRTANPVTSSGYYGYLTQRHSS